MSAPALRPRACGPVAWRLWGQTAFVQGCRIKPSVWLAWLALCTTTMAVAASGLPGWGVLAALVPWIQGAWLQTWRASLAQCQGLVLEQVMHTVRKAPRLKARQMWSFLWGGVGLLVTLQPTPGWEEVGSAGALFMSLALFLRFGGPIGLVEDLEARLPLNRLEALQATLAAWTLNAWSIGCLGLGVVVLVIASLAWPPLCVVVWPLSVGLRHAAYLDIFEQLPAHASQPLTWPVERAKIN